MNTKRYFYAAIVCLLAAVPLSVVAQQASEPGGRIRMRLQPESQPQPEPEADIEEQFPETSEPAEPRAPRRESRDPTTVRPDLRPILDPPEGEARPTLPSIVLRGRIVMPNGKAVGMIQAGDQLITIESGSRIEIAGVTLEVKALSASEVVLTAEELDRTIKLR